VSQLISGLDAAYSKRNRTSWQDTTVPPNLLVTHLGPGRVSLDLQTYLDIADDKYHRESMKGQTADIPNFLSISGIFHPPATPPGANYIDQWFNRHTVQDTTIHRNPVLDLVLTGTPPFSLFSNRFEAEETYRHDSLSGQYARSGAIVSLGVPPAFNEIYTFVSRLKTAQEPYVYPNALLIGQAATTLPYVYGQGESLQYKAHAAQEPYQFPNLVASNLNITRPLVNQQYEALQFKVHAAQEPYIYQNVLIPGVPPFIIQPFIQHQYEDLQWRGHKTQEHYDFPNGIIYWITPLPPSIEVPCVMALTQAAAIALIQSFGFTNIQVNYAYDLVNLPGIVFGQSPQPYTYVSPITLIQITVSQGPFIPNAVPLPPMKVTTRAFSLEEMVAREWGSSFHAPDHGVYVFSNNRRFDSTDMGNTGIYEKGEEDPAKPCKPN
jgi:hypothetical protein